MSTTCQVYSSSTLEGIASVASCCTQNEILHFLSVFKQPQNETSFNYCDLKRNSLQFFGCITFHMQHFSFHWWNYTAHLWQCWTFIPTKHHKLSGSLQKIKAKAWNRAAVPYIKTYKLKITIKWGITQKICNTCSLSFCFHYFELLLFTIIPVSQISSPPVQFHLFN